MFILYTSISGMDNSQILEFYLSKCNAEVPFNTHEIELFYSIFIDPNICSDFSVTGVFIAL